MKSAMNSRKYEGKHYWAENKLHKSEAIASKKKFYCSRNVPYPSVRSIWVTFANYAIGDPLIAPLQTYGGGINVLSPDGLGCLRPSSENAAIRIRCTPQNGPMRY